MPHHAFEEEDDDARDAKESRNQGAQEVDLDPRAKEVDHPEDDRADNAVRDELPHDAKRQRKHLAEDGKNQNGECDACSNIQVISPFCFPWRARASPHLHTRDHRPRAAREQCASHESPLASGVWQYTSPSPPPRRWDWSQR